MLSFAESFFEESTITSIFKELSGTSKIDFYDDFGMLKKKAVLNGNNEILSHTYKYKTRSNSKYVSKQIAKEVIKTKNSTYTERVYETDKVGNITRITDNQFGSETYQYNQNGFVTKVGSDTIEYDNNGNILKYKTNTYTYDNLIKDRLVKFNNGTITYDANNPLNPISYEGNTFEYEGRRLVKYNGVTYKYDIDGKRISKNGNGYATKYYYNGDKLIAEDGDVTLDYLYDENNLLLGLIYQNRKYFYIRDAFQNILGLVDLNGNVVVKYKYDLFGNLIDISGSEASTIGKYNHFRFKGYYFDEESNMYYCKSRYYVPEWGRWLNLDSPSFLDATSVTRLNLFAYCENNSVTNVDYNGNFGIIASWLIGIAISTVVSLVNEVIEDVSTDGKLGGDKSWKDYTGAAIGGAIGGAGIGVGTSALAGGIGSVVDGLITGEVDSVEDTVLQFGVGAATSAVGDLISGGISNRIANKRISPILSGKNNKINKRLSKLPISKKAKKRLGKVGVVGHKTMYKNLYRELHYEELESLISGGFSILISPLF